MIVKNIGVLWNKAQNAFLYNCQMEHLGYLSVIILMQSGSDLVDILFNQH